MPPEGEGLSPILPVPPLAEREAGAGYAAAARALSAVPVLGGRDAPPDPAGLPGLDAAGLRAAGIDTLLPGGGAGLALPLALALLRPDVRRWLGPERVVVLAGRLGQDEREVALLLDAPPVPPAALGEAVSWNGRQVPLLTPAGSVAWLHLFWRPDRGAPRKGEKRQVGDRVVLAARLILPGAGRVELRARLEDGRLDAVMETAFALPRAMAADLADGFAAVLRRLRLQGDLTVRHTDQDRGT